MKIQPVARQSNKSVIYDEELTIPAGEELVLDFTRLSNGLYAIGVPFKNVELQNLGDATGSYSQNLVLYYNQAVKQSQKIRSNFVFEKSEREIYSLKIKNTSATQQAVFDLRLDNQDSQLEVLKQIRDKVKVSKGIGEVVRG